MTAWLLPLLAHESVWDEIALVAVPLLGLWLLLAMANRRAKRIAGNQSED